MVMTSDFYAYVGFTVTYSDRDLKVAGSSPAVGSWITFFAFCTPQIHFTISYIVQIKLKSQISNVVIQGSDLFLACEKG